jgi:uncharacterized iron-regulated membrane protein
MSAARKWVLWTHLGVGMVAGVLMSLTGLTGSLLVFGDEIDRLLNPALLRVQPDAQRVPLDKVMIDVRSAFPDRRIHRIHLAYEPESSLEVCFAEGADPSCVYVNPYTGARLGVRVPTLSFKGQLFSFHRRLCSGPVGETLVGIEGALLIALSLTGLSLWTHVRRPAWRRRPSAAATPYVRRFDLHRLVGLCALPLLLVLAATGTAMIFRPTFEGTLNSLASTPMPGPPSVSATTSAMSLSLDAVLRTIRMAVPDAEPTYVILPASPIASLAVRARVRGEWLPKGRSFIYVHPLTGTILRVDHAFKSPIGYRVGSALYPLHVGLLGGMPTRALLSLVGLTPAMLWWTGTLMWWRRISPKHHSAR